MRMQEVAALVAAPLNEELRPEERLESCLMLSNLVVRMVTHVICHVIVDYEEQLQAERLSVANAFLQRVTSTHLCNHKLTREGITFEYNGQAFDLHEEYKTMTLTRSVYEHLVMFYFLFAHPKSAEERSVVWNYWKINSKKNLLDYAADESTVRRTCWIMRLMIMARLPTNSVRRKQRLRPCVRRYSPQRRAGYAGGGWTNGRASANLRRTAVLSSIGRTDGWRCGVCLIIRRGSTSLTKRGWRFYTAT